MNILIAEDEEQIANSLAKSFLEVNFQSKIAPNGAIAIEYYLNYKFDVVLLDWKMPILSGIDVCKKN